jgi:hypothetical protein
VEEISAFSSVYSKHKSSLYHLPSGKTPVTFAMKLNPSMTSLMALASYISGSVAFPTAETSANQLSVFSQRQCRTAYQDL